MRTRWVVLTGVAVALLLAGVVSIFASSAPDGLTKVSQDHGFDHTGRTHDSVVGGYGPVTGIVGVVVVLALAAGVTYVVRRRHSDPTE
ncbi:MAG: PDGLE domain-containing protein [Nocardioidaceae bacterium]|nr:PDGLE domain-containing protein [Nocardioidaceae bacterium]